MHFHCPCPIKCVLTYALLCFKYIRFEVGMFFQTVLILVIFAFMVKIICLFSMEVLTGIKTGMLKPGCHPVINKNGLKFRHKLRKIFHLQFLSLNQFPQSFQDFPRVSVYFVSSKCRWVVTHHFVVHNSQTALYYA